MGCGGSKEGGVGDMAAGSPPRPQQQDADKAKDVAASEIQGAAAAYIAQKKAEGAKDAAAAEIQGSAAAYLAKKRADQEKEGGGGLGSLFGLGK